MEDLRAPPEGRDSTFGARVLVSSLFFVTTICLVWRAGSGLASLNADSRSNWTAVIVIAGLPAAMAVASAAFGFAIARGRVSSTEAQNENGQSGSTSPIISALKIIGPIVIGLSPIFLHAPAGQSWSQLARDAAVPLIGASLLGAVVASLVLFVGRRSRRRTARATSREPRSKPDV